jgi:hypothetical protein
VVVPAGQFCSYEKVLNLPRGADLGLR